MLCFDFMAVLSIMCASGALQTECAMYYQTLLLSLILQTTMAEHAEETTAAISSEPDQPREEQTQAGSSEGKLLCFTFPSKVHKNQVIQSLCLALSILSLVR